MSKLTIASFNTFGVSLNFYNLALRYKAIANYFNTSNVDVIHFQEVFTYFHLSLLQNSLKNYPYCQYKKSYMGPRGGLVIFSRYALTETHFISFSKEFIPLQSKLELLTQKGMLLSKVGNFGILLINTHLTAVINHDWNNTSKYCRELSSEINELHKIIKNKTKDMIITSGDFNIAKGSFLYEKLINLEQLFDPFKKDNLPTRHKTSHKQSLKTLLEGKITNSVYKSARKLNCVDYIFICGNRNMYKIVNKKYLFSNKIRLKKNQVGYVSDHTGLQITLLT